MKTPFIRILILLCVVACSLGAQAQRSIDLINDNDRVQLDEAIGLMDNGKPVYTNGKNFITPDVDGHNGGVWKMGKSVKALQNKSTRMGTYDSNLKRIGD